MRLRLTISGRSIDAVAGVEQVASARRSIQRLFEL